MTLTDLAMGEPWMDPEERRTVAGLVQSIEQSFTEREIRADPLLVLRVQDFLVHHTLCRRLERSLAPGPDPAAFAAALPKLAEQVGKCRDRLRRSLKELEVAVAKLAPPPPPPLPPENPAHLCDFYKTLLEEVGVDLINDPDFFADEDNHYDIPCGQCDVIQSHAGPEDSPSGADIPGRSTATPTPSTVPSHDSHSSHASRRSLPASDP